MTFRLILRVREKRTHRTWTVYWPSLVTYMTGRKEVVLHRSGFTEFNAYEEPVLDSWVHAECIIEKRPGG